MKEWLLVIRGVTMGLMPMEKQHDVAKSKGSDGFMPMTSVDGC